MTGRRARKSGLVASEMVDSRQVRLHELSVALISARATVKRLEDEHRSLLGETMGGGFAARCFEELNRRSSLKKVACMLTEESVCFARSMLAGYVFYSSRAPRIPPRVREELGHFGLRLQSESPRHEDTFFYPLDMKEFRERFEALLV